MNANSLQMMNKVLALSLATFLLSAASQIYLGRSLIGAAVAHDSDDVISVAASIKLPPYDPAVLFSATVLGGAEQSELQR